MHADGAGANATALRTRLGRLGSALNEHAGPRPIRVHRRASAVPFSCFPACRFCVAKPAVVMRPAGCSAAHRAGPFWCMGSCRHATGRPAFDHRAPSAGTLCGNSVPPSPRRAELVHGLLAARRMALAGSFEAPARPDRWTRGVAAEQRLSRSDPPSRPASHDAIAAGWGAATGQPCGPVRRAAAQASKRLTQMHAALCSNRHKGSSSPRKRRESGDPCGIGLRFRARACTHVMLGAQHNTALLSGNVR
jgi:hypothetical protein